MTAVVRFNFAAMGFFPLAPVLAFPAAGPLQAEETNYCHDPAAEAEW